MDSARVSRVGFGVTPKESFNFRAPELEEILNEKLATARTRSPARETRARYPSGASSGAATTRVGTSLSPEPVFSSAAAGPASWYSASLFTCQRS